VNRRHHTEVAVCEVICQLPPHHGDCKRHGTLFAICVQLWRTARVAHVRDQRLSWSPTFTTKILVVDLFYRWDLSTLPWSKRDFSTYRTEVILTVHTVTGHFYPVWNKGWYKGVSQREQRTRRTGTTASSQKDSYNSKEQSTTTLVDQVVLRMWPGMRSHATSVSTGKSLLRDPVRNPETKVNPQFSSHFRVQHPKISWD
jgi:hypothetical protein